jgi:hypothetical protein
VRRWMWRVLSFGVNDAGIRSVIGGAGGLGTTASAVVRRAARLLMRRRKASESTSKAGAKSVQIALTGYDLINSPRLNKGTAFSDHERDLFELHGLLPPHVGTLNEQVERRMNVLEQESTPFAKYSFLRDLQDTNETLFYALLLRNVNKFRAEEGV